MELIAVRPYVLLINPRTLETSKHSTFWGGRPAAGEGSAAAAAPPHLQALKRRCHLLADALGSPAAVTTTTLTTTTCEHCCAAGCYAGTTVKFAGQAAVGQSLYTVVQAGT